jgi:hypothetical protein
MLCSGREYSWPEQSMKLSAFCSVLLWPDGDTRLKESRENGENCIDDKPFFVQTDG